MILIKKLVKYFFFFGGGQNKKWFGICFCGCHFIGIGLVSVYDFTENDISNPGEQRQLPGPPLLRQPWYKDYHFCVYRWSAIVLDN